MDYLKLSKEISYALRHAPWEYELELDDEGFVPVTQLLLALNEGRGRERTIEEADIIYMMEASEKQRHEIVDGRIRALYGHSIDKRIRKEQAIPPALLYHGTTHNAFGAILRCGLKPMGRQYVHLSVDAETALAVGKRRDSDPVLLQVDAESASRDGVPFYIGNNKVWLADGIPADYLQRL